MFGKGVVENNVYYTSSNDWMSKLYIRCLKMDGLSPVRALSEGCLMYLRDVFRMERRSTCERNVSG